MTFCSLSDLRLKGHLESFLETQRTGYLPFFSTPQAPSETTDPEDFIIYQTLNLVDGALVSTSSPEDEMKKTIPFYILKGVDIQRFALKILSSPRTPSKGPDSNRVEFSIAELLVLAGPYQYLYRNEDSHAGPSWEDHISKRCYGESKRENCNACEYQKHALSAIPDGFNTLQSLGYFQNAEDVQPLIEACLDKIASTIRAIRHPLDRCAGIRRSLFG